jgi:Phosphosulfolactate phosphohydrolase and related enzymes
MRLDVAFSPAGLTLAEVQGRTVFVIDILRATTSMCAALHHGAKAVIPVGSTEEALRLAQTIGSEDVLLAGEQDCVRIAGFHLGNSPLEMAEPSVRGKTLIVTTTNGTKAMLACQGASAVYGACAANLSVSAEKARETIERNGRILIVCAGRDGAFSMDDAYCAGRLAAAALGDIVRGAGSTMRPSRASTWFAVTATTGSVRSGAAGPAASSSGWASVTTSWTPPGSTRTPCWPISTNAE